MSDFLDPSVSLLLKLPHLETLHKWADGPLVDGPPREHVGCRIAQNHTTQLRFEARPNRQLAFHPAHVVDGHPEAV